jgi:hypothetical protein
MRIGPIVIYLDSSLVLARLFAEKRSPPDTLWDLPLVSSRLLSYEVWSRVNSLRRDGSHGEQAWALINRIEMLAMTPAILGRALEPFPRPVRTLDGLHLASIEYLRGRGRAVELASYDPRLNVAARALGIPLAAI